MTFEQFVNEVFSDHHDSMGMDSEEIQNIIEESTPEQRKRWLERQGYDLESDFNNL